MTETELEYQFCFNCNDRKNCYTKPKDCTRIKEEIGLQDMTNEEWFCQLSTEEKAKWITENLSVYADDWVKRDEKLLNPATWEEWLKDKHNGV